MVQPLPRRSIWFYRAVWFHHIMHQCINVLSRSQWATTCWKLAIIRRLHTWDGSRILEGVHYGIWGTEVPQAMTSWWSCAIIILLWCTAMMHCEKKQNLARRRFYAVIGRVRRGSSYHNDSPPLLPWNCLIQVTAENVYFTFACLR